MSDENQVDYSLSDLIEAVVATRVYVASTFLAATLGFWAYVTLLSVASPPVHSYTTRVEFTFSGIENDLYPNGTPFRLSDVIAPAVLNVLYDQHAIEQYLSRNEFVNAFSIAPYTPARSLVLAKYLNNTPRTAQPAELDERQERLATELSVLAKRSAEIRFTSVKGEVIPLPLLVQVLQGTAREWNTHRVSDLGVLTVPDARFRRDQPAALYRI